MNKISIPLAAITMLMLAANAFSASLQTIPLYHWTYDIIDELVVRGCLHDLNHLTKPYNYAQITQALDNCSLQPDDPHSEQLLKLLNDYFTVDSDRKLQLGTYIDQDLKIRDDQLKPRTALLTKIGYAVSDRLVLFNSMRLDQNLQDDPEYQGKYWRGFSGYTEQAYIAAGFGPLAIQFGRDYQQWGAGRKSNLLFSDNSLPFDLGRLTLNAGKFTFTMTAMQLDQITAANSNLAAGAVDSTRKNRFLTAHRIDWKVSDKLQIGFSESVLYGGAGRNFEWQFLNPVMIYHFEQENRSIEGNTIVGADFIAFPAKNWSVYGELIVDDWQFDRKKVSDLEPPEVGWIIGCRKAAPFNLASAVASLEYSGVTNRTYNTLQPEQKHLHQDKNIGHELGNNFDCWLFEVSNWFNPKFRGTVSFSFIRDGEGSVQDTFDTRFYEVQNVSDGYSEPFPFGIVERTYKPGIGLWYRYHERLFFRLESEFSFTDNYLNENGVKNEDYFIVLGLNFQFDGFFDI